MTINPFDDNEFAWAAEFNALANADGAGAIISGCSISKGTGDWDIDVTSGQIIESNTEASISAGTVTITDASALSAGESRVTLIHADTGDALASTDGAAAADPASPDIPASEVLLGYVIVSNGDSTAADSDIRDIPALRQNDNALLKDGGSHELEADDLAGANGVEGQFLESDGSAAFWGTFDTESGSFTRGSNGTTTVTLANTYLENAFIPSISAYTPDQPGDDDTSSAGFVAQGARITAINTDGNGDVTGFDVTVNAYTYFEDNATINWHTWGVRA